MSLLDSICCPKHGNRTAVVYDDLGARSPCFLTYSELIWRVQVVAEVLSRHQGSTSSPQAPVATYGRACPEILVAILSILASPLYNQRGVGVVKGVAYLPLSPSSNGGNGSGLLECGVELIVIEISALQEFTVSFETWYSCRLVAMDTSSLLHLGLVVARVSWVVVNKPRKVSLEFPPTTMAEYANDCDLTCYACVCLHDPHCHGNKSDLINRTAGRDSSGHSEHSDLNKTSMSSPSGHNVHHDLINRTLNDSSVHSKHSDQMNRTGYSVSSGHPTTVECVSHKDNADLINRSPSSFFPRWDGEWPEKCSGHMISVTAGDEVGSVGAFHPSSRDLIINNRTAIFPRHVSCKMFPIHLLSPDEVAVVLSTSGTTGDPVSVRVPHCSILPNILDLRSRFNVTADDIIFNASPLTFDPSIVEIFLALSSGSALLMVPETTKQSPSDLANILFRRQYASFLQITPSLLFRFPAGVIRGQLLGRASHVRVLALGGEQCPTTKLLAEWKHVEVSREIAPFSIESDIRTCDGMSNKTAVYNLYGITEVSSWATCHRLSFSSANKHSLVPLGQPLLGTTLEVRDADTNCKVTQGHGIIWLGGRYRVCLIGDETAPPSESMRCSGDCASVDGEGGVVCIGRGDRQVKRHGQRVNLDTIQQNILSNLDEISSCVLHSISRNSTPLKTHPFPRDEPMLIGFAVPSCGGGVECAESSGRGSGHLLRKLRRALPSSWVPDRLILIERLPITPHGKVNIPDLLNTLDRHNASGDTGQSHTLLKPLPSVTPTKTWTTSLLTSAISTMTGQSPCTSDTRLTDAGIDSFDIVRLANQITAELVGIFGVSTPSMPYMVEKMLDGSIGEVAGYMASSLTSASLGDSEVSCSNRTFKRPSSNAANEHDCLAKRERDSSVASCGWHVTPTNHVIHCRDHVTSTLVESWRRGQYFINGSLQVEQVTLGKETGSKVGIVRLANSCSILWQANTGKCVDASPLLVQRTESRGASDRRERSFLCSPGANEEAARITTPRAAGRNGVVYVGSHSHLFLAVELATGREVWRAELGDRVESSACVSVCGDFIAVGCYDGCLYVLQSCSGQVHWRFQPQSDGEPLPVKCSPCVDATTGWVWFGSHDHHLYAVDIYERRLLHKLYPGGGSIFSTPCLDHCRRVIYCATLSGRVAAFSTDSGLVIWSRSVSKTPIFSSLTLLPDGDKVVFGCVDGSLYSLRTEDGQLEWRTNLGGEVYSVPFCHQVRMGGGVEVWCVSVATTCGTLYTLDAGSGKVLQEVCLPGQVFSSPVCMDGCVVIGCRDNHVYCIDICAD